MDVAIPCNNKVRGYVTKLLSVSNTYIHLARETCTWRWLYVDIGDMEEEKWERSKGQAGALEKIMKERSLRVDVKQGIRNSVLIPILTYASDMRWMWNAVQQ